MNVAMVALDPNRRLDPGEILAALGVGETERVTPVPGGWDTALWRVKRGGADYALRVLRPEQAETSRREVEAMRAVAAAGLPVPTVHAYGCWQERPALLLGWCPGRTIIAELGAHPWRAWSLGALMGHTQAAIHAVAPPAALRGGAPSWLDWHGPTEPALAARLRALAPRPDALLHLDVHPANLMVDGGRVSGVLDWANVRIGDPRADLARTVTLLRLAPAPPGLPVHVIAVLRRVLAAGWRHGYRQRAGAVGDLAPFLAWAGAVMERDLRPKLGQPGVWLTAGDLARIRRWTEDWRERAGLAA